MIASPDKKTTQPAYVGGQLQYYDWSYEERSVTIAYETLGAGPKILLLPAFSTVSTRLELAKIAQVLASQFQVIAIDWLGFGDSERPAMNYGRSLYQTLLRDFVTDCCPEPFGILAAGHGAGYALDLAQHHSDLRLLLVAPTWKGPLRAMGAPDWLASTFRNMVRVPVLGPVLYGLNTHPAFLKWMFRRHVFVDETRLTPEFIQERHRITQKPGARFAPVAFVTAGLDPMGDRPEWLSTATKVLADNKNSLGVIMAENAPPKSKAEMKALTELPNVTTFSLPGTLGLYEEYADEVSAIALSHFQA